MRRISVKTPNKAVTEPATVEACQQDRQGRNDAVQAAEASVQRGLISAHLDIARARK